MIKTNLKFLRAQKKVSQQEVADYLHITRQAYNNYETGKREPDYETLLKLGEYFNISIDDLLSEDSLDEIDETLIILNRKIKNLSPDKRKKLLDVANVMFKEDFGD